MMRERGSVSVVVAAAIAMTLVVTMGAADVGRAALARSRAEAVADLTALAAAQSLALSATVDPIEDAQRFAVANGARLVSCTCAAGSFEATVTVALDVEGFLLPIADRVVLASARAVVEVPA
jgi:secretion/DNA translocation related TadE-like protein